MCRSVLSLIIEGEKMIGFSVEKNCRISVCSVIDN